jgi:hypothetical protein
LRLRARGDHVGELRARGVQQHTIVWRAAGVHSSIARTVEAQPVVKGIAARGERVNQATRRRSFCPNSKKIDFHRSSLAKHPGFVHGQLSIPSANIILILHYSRSPRPE